MAFDGKYTVTWQVGKGRTRKRAVLRLSQAQLVARNVVAARIEGCGFWESWFAGVLASYGRQDGN